MKTPRAVIFDVYRTLLEVVPPERDMSGDWQQLHGTVFGSAPECSLEELSQRCRSLVADDHRAAHEAGIRYPEVIWESVMTRALPGLAGLAGETRAEFLFRHMQLLRTLKLSAGAAEFIRLSLNRGWLLGVASNAQAYTLRELGEALAAAGLSLSVFTPDLVFWSFANGFSKPDPYVFRLLTARLAARGIAPGEALMIGDRLDNDVEPSRAQGWQAWWLNESAEGNWQALLGAYSDPGPASQATP